MKNELEFVVLCVILLTFASAAGATALSLVESGADTTSALPDLPPPPVAAAPT